MSTHGFAAPVVLLLLFSSGQPARAQPGTGARGRLAAATTLRCSSPLLATGDWTNGEPQAESKPAKLSFTFSGVDAQDGTAEADLGYGPSHIIVRLAEGSLHFIQVGSAGPVYLTTVFDQESRAGKLKAVHTRHEYTPVKVAGFTSRPEQYYGECEVAQ
jgi:hypothetical protein